MKKLRHIASESPESYVKAKWPKLVAQIQLDEFHINCLNILATLLCGLHHANDKELEKMIRGIGMSRMSYLYFGSLATHDFNELTMLTIMACMVGIRIATVGMGKNKILIVFNRRGGGPTNFTEGHWGLAQNIQFLQKHCTIED